MLVNLLKIDQNAPPPPLPPPWEHNSKWWVLRIPWVKIYTDITYTPSRIKSTNTSLSKHAGAYRCLFLPTSLQSRAGLQRGSASACWEMCTLGGWSWRWALVERGCVELNLNGSQLTSIRKGGFLRSWEASICKRLGTELREANYVLNHCDAVRKVSLDWRDDPKIRDIHPLDTSTLGLAWVTWSWLIQGSFSSGDI